MAAHVKTETDEDELVVDEPTAVISSAPIEQPLILRMKLNMDPSGVASLGAVETPDSYRQSVCRFVQSFLFDIISSL